MNMKLTLYHFFPDKLNLYGDRGNVIALKKMCEWMGIELEIIEVYSVNGLNMKKADILFIGGGPDSLQTLCTEELFTIKKEFKEAIEDGISALTICGGYQFLGTHYITANGEKLDGLGILDFYTEAKPPSERLIGNIAIESKKFGRIVGYENHGGRTYHKYETLGKVVFGHGNNDEDKKEGLLYKNLIGTYLHGPILPKNPNITKFLINSAVNRRYGEVQSKEVDIQLESEANKKVWDRVAK